MERRPEVQVTCSMSRGMLLSGVASTNNNRELFDSILRTEEAARTIQRLVNCKSCNAHWFFASLASPSRQERLIACKLLLEAYKSGDLHWKVRWIHVIGIYLHNTNHKTELLEGSALFRSLMDQLPEIEQIAISKYYWGFFCKKLYESSHPQSLLGLLKPQESNETSLSFLLGAWARRPKLLNTLVHPNQTTNEQTNATDDHGEDHDDEEIEEGDVVLDIHHHSSDDDEEAAEEEDEDDNDEEEVEGDEEVESLESIEEVDDDHSEERSVSVNLHEIDEAEVQAMEIVHEEVEAPKPVIRQPKQPAIYVRASMNVLSWKSLQISETMRLLELVCNIIQPPTKPLQTRILLRRAPTQEEFFRGNLRRNPIPASILGNDDPTVHDLKVHIARDLQMADSAELIEILVANKILQNSLKLRVVNQVLWRKHLMEGGGGTTSVVHSGSAFSIILSSTSERRITEDTPDSSLPPMVATYRLAGVDGEATEDTVEELEDPKCVKNADSEERLEAEFGLTKHVDFPLLLETIQASIYDSLRRIRRDDVDQTKHARQEFMNSPPNPALTLLKYCSQLPANRLALLNVRAPTVLLRSLLDILVYIQEENNPTAALLQELIEALTSDISSGSNFSHAVKQQDASNLQLLLQSIETIKLPPALRNVVARLLPYLTYGNNELSRELAKHFDNHINMESSGSMLLETFVETAISLPANEVCDCLRTELIHCGFIDRLALFIVKGMPSDPPFWSPALWQKGETIERNKGWGKYYNREGLSVALQVLTGLCRQHAPSQSRIAMHASFLRACHWLEITSDSSKHAIETNGLGLLAETLLDGLVDNNMDVAKMVDKARHKTRMRKKELAEERRNKALMKMGKFSGSNSKDRGFAASLLAPVAGLFRSNNSNPGETSVASAAKNKKVPDWLAEADSMKEEVGLTCAVCQEGRTLQPKELLGLYAFVKKVAIPVDTGGSRLAIDGTHLLKALPDSLPDNANAFAEEWFAMAKAAASNLSDSSSSSTNARRMSNIYTTTVSAGTGIHINCHRRARQVDRSHPRAPKSEWEGAGLRNNRVKCNVILPLVSSNSSKVPLVAVDSALSEHHAAISTFLGTSPGSTLWNALHDVRFLLLRISYGESLSDDCGGGSLHSNCLLLYYQILMADVYCKAAQVDQPDVAMHARGLSDGILAACSIARVDSPSCTNALRRGIADAAPMAALTCIVFHNTLGESAKPHPKRRWIVGRDLFLQALIICAGRRHSRGMNGSGCQTRRSRSSSFADWDEPAEDDELRIEDARPKKRKRGRITGLTVEDFQNVLRPFITLYAIFDQISSDFGCTMDDLQVEQAAQHLVKVIEDCQKSRSIYELLRISKVTMEQNDIIDLVQSGMTVC